jgi:uncharacterized SAM-binding protein YcdF (DUF218 family)
MFRSLCVLGKKQGYAMFLLKKIVSMMLNPLPVCLLLLFVGVVLLWRGKQPKWGRRFITAGFSALLLLSLAFIPQGAVRALEDDYAVFSPTQHPGVAVRWVVVLGGGVRDEPGLPPNEQLTASSLVRLVEGVRVLQFYPDARLLLAGGGYLNDIPEAVAMQGVTAFLGVDSARVRLEQASNDTADQAANVRRMVGDDAFVLVTSAMHLRRAMALFNKQGMRPLPAPAHHVVRPHGRLDYRAFFPSAANMGALQAAWHEYLGLLWGRLTGQSGR